jgi:hypothetical protein
MCDAKLTEVCTLLPLSVYVCIVDETVLLRMAVIQANYSPSEICVKVAMGQVFLANFPTMLLFVYHLWYA